MLSSPVIAPRLEREVAGIARQTEEKYTGRSAVRLAHHAWSVSVAGIARQTEEKNTGRSAVRLTHHA